MAVKYCPVAGQFKDCTGCPNFQCMDFFLYVIEDAKTAEDVRFIESTVNPLASAMGI